MKYFIIGNAIDVNPTAPAGEVAMFEQRIISSLEMMAKWEEEGKFTWGCFAGRTDAAFILEAESHEEAARQPIRAQADMARQQLQTLKTIAKP